MKSRRKGEKKRLEKLFGKKKIMPLTSLILEKKRETDPGSRVPAVGDVAQSEVPVLALLTGITTTTTTNSRQNVRSSNLKAARESDLLTFRGVSKAHYLEPTVSTSWSGPRVYYGQCVHSMNAQETKVKSAQW